MLKYKIPQIVTLTRYTLKRKLTNQENPLTHNNEYDVGLLE